MEKKKALSLPAAVSVAVSLGFFSCQLFKPESAPAGEITPGAELMGVNNYRVSGNKIITDMPDTIDCWTGCWDDSMVEYCDTVEAYSDTVTYDLTGNTLMLYFPFDTLDTSEAVVTMCLILSRKGSGGGLEGVWSVSDLSYEIIQGNPTQGEITGLETEIAFLKKMFTEKMIMEYEFSAGQLKGYSKQIQDFADGFIDDWNGWWYDDPALADSAQYDIAVTKVDANIVTLYGNLSEETVTIKHNPSAHSITYSSNDPAHAPHTYFEDTETCPNDDYPQWWWDFHQGNLKKSPLFKSTNSGEKRKNHRFNIFERFIK
jgi:hypothetical protein